MRIKIKPLSVNDAWRWRRIKSDEYIKYTSDLFILLPSRVIIPKWPLEVIYKFGLSNKNADYDNPVKPFQDVFFSKYWINDKLIFRAIVEKEIVKKWEEYAEIHILEYKKRNFF